MVRLKKWLDLQAQIPIVGQEADDQDKLLRHLLVILTELGEELSAMNANIAHK